MIGAGPLNQFGMAALFHDLRSGGLRNDRGELPIGLDPRRRSDGRKQKCPQNRSREAELADGWDVLHGTTIP